MLSEFLNELIHFLADVLCDSVYHVFCSLLLHVFQVTLYSLKTLVKPKLILLIVFFGLPLLSFPLD